jgi:hypothetical protein
MFEPNTRASDKLVEELAALEHLQWSHWTKYMLENLTPENIERWKKQIETPYEELDEKEKESDRKWARKVLGVTLVVAQKWFDKWTMNLEKRLKKRG